jgi:hypothetical protein
MRVGATCCLSQHSENTGSFPIDRTKAPAVIVAFISLSIQMPWQYIINPPRPSQPPTPQNTCKAGNNFTYLTLEMYDPVT